MKTFISFLIFCLVATCNAELRTWTAVNGKEVEAEFVSNEEGVVKLKLKSGKVFEVPLNKLSKADQEFLKANPFSDSLEDNIVGKLMTLETEGYATELQFNEDGRIMVRMNDFGLTYKIDNNDVLFFKGEELDGGISFSSSSPNVGDQVEWGPKQEKMRAKITMIQEAINFESQLVGKWMAKVSGAKALFTFPAIEAQTEWSWYNKKTPPNALEYRWEVKFVNPEFGYSFGPSLFKFSDSEGPVKGSLSELIGVCQHDLWKLSEDSGENIGSYGQTKVTENKVHLIVTNKILIDYLLESKPVHVEMMINTPRFGFNEKVAVDYELPNASKEKHQEVKEEVKNKEPVNGIDFDELEKREGIYYLLDSDTPYTGKSFRSYSNGQKSEVNWKDGKENGLYVSWYVGGQKKAERTYKDGKWDGLWVFWHSNGKKQIEANYKEGNLDGLVVNWHFNGQKFSEANYKDGELISEKFWNNKGEPVDTYEEAE